MSELIGSTLSGAFEALDITAMTSLAPVFSDVPQKQQPPFVELGAIDAEEVEGADGLELHSIEIEYQYRGSSRLPLLAMMKTGRAALEAGLSAAGIAFGDVRWLASATDREDDGVTWHGIQKYAVHVQADD